MHLPFGSQVSAPASFVGHAKRWSRSRSNALQRRDTGGLSSAAIGAIVGGIVVLFVLVLLLRWWWQRRRLSTSSKGKHQPLTGDDQTDDASTVHSRRMRERQVEAGTGDAASQRRSRSVINNATNGAANRNSATTTVDRNTSIRSIMTLPAYRPSASQNEQVLGVEGDRDGIDVVVEMPTAEEEEEQREEEMEALYQIRLARRRQIAEREERRRERQQARERHDFVALDELRVRANEATTNSSEEISSLRTGLDQIKIRRQRAVSSVSYADLGVARADGTRIRANSQESERVGLLSDAASIAPSITAPSLLHQRNRSTSSVLTIESAQSDGRSSPGLGMGGSSMYNVVSRPRSRAGSRTQTSRSGSQRAGSSPEIIEPEMDLADADLPPHSPPGYHEVSLDDLAPRHSRSASPYPDAPPDYPGPTQAREARLSAHIADLAAEAGQNQRQAGRGLGGLPQLPSLRLNRLPQIVIEPSSALPDDDHHR